MISNLIHFSIRNRLLVVLVFIFVAALGIYNFGRLPIDAVPDITNVQVQINTSAEGSFDSPSRETDNFSYRDFDERSS